MLARQSGFDERARVEVVIRFVHQNRDFIFVGGGQNALELFFGIRIAQGVVRLHQNKQLRVGRQLFQNALDGHLQIFGIRDRHERAAVHLRIHFEHGVRGGHAHNATAGKRERLHDLTDAFG